MLLIEARKGPTGSISRAKKKKKKKSYSGYYTYQNCDGGWLYRMAGYTARMEWPSTEAEDALSQALSLSPLKEEPLLVATCNSQNIERHGLFSSFTLAFGKTSSNLFMGFLLG
jgi:hypothetical protein